MKDVNIAGRKEETGAAEEEAEETEAEETEAEETEAEETEVPPLPLCTPLRH